MQVALVFRSGQGSAALGGGLHGVLSGQSSTSSETADSDMEDELEEVRHEDWVSMVDEHGRQFHWNRRHNTTHWSMPLRTLHRWVCLLRGTFLEVESQVDAQCG